jgi:Amt family ammonium transporter
VPVLRLRATEEEEALGIDDVEIGEFAVSSYTLTHTLCNKREHALIVL